MISITVLSLALSACQAERKVVSTPSSVSSGKSAALQVMEQVAIAAHKCWFAAKDPAFRAYRMANELNSFSGRPRFLLVPAKNYEAKPLLVVQAEGASRRVEYFGPLLDDKLGGRITGDIARWSSGNNACASNA
ncbi:hypothetical protein GA830_14965 [Mesorhizobium sp. NBSH29]|nr:hypothetical protein GA830_14965 [Mesorhizobium sp. NBSH29]